jgi:hypothetical protein
MHQARPFQPFKIHFVDGRTLEIAHPELLAVIPPGRTFFVAHANGHFEIVDLLLVTSLESSNGTPRRRRR